MRWCLYVGVVMACWVSNLHAADIFHAQGEFAGEVTASSVLLQSRLTSIPGPELDRDGDLPGAAGIACFEWSISPDFKASHRTAWQTAAAESDFIIRAKLTELQPKSTYSYRLIYGMTEASIKTGPARQFQTLPDPQATASMKFIMGSCQNYAFFMHGKNGDGSNASAEDQRLGYPVYAAMLKQQPDFFIGTGDIVYYDHPASTAAKTLPELRRKWHEQFRFPRMIEFFGRTPAYWSKDDHDFRFNDADLTGGKLPQPTTGIEIFREQMPIHSAGDGKSPTYRTHRINRHLQLWFLEGRDFRSPNSTPDGPEKTIWGKEQRAWLQKSLLASDATWKILISPTPLVGPDTKGKIDNHTNLKGFRHEAESFFQWLNEQKVSPVFSFCGDRHWQYHSIHPSGVEEFGCGALNDENAIAGVRPGKENSTDPEGLIKQPYHYPKPTGGFLAVTIGNKLRPDDLQIAFYDDEGTELYKITKRSKSSP